MGAVKGQGRSVRHGCYGGCGRGCGDGDVAVAAGVDLAAGRFDALPGAAGVAVAVLRAGGVVGCRDGFDDHGEGAGAVVGGSAGPG